MHCMHKLGHINIGGGGAGTELPNLRREHEDDSIKGSEAAHLQKSLLASGDDWYSLGLHAQVTSEVFHPIKVIIGEPLTLWHIVQWQNVQ